MEYKDKWVSMETSCYTFFSPAMASTYPHIAQFLFLLLSFSLKTNSLHFNFPSFNQTNPIVDLQGNASISDSQIQLTRNEVGSLVGNYGRALYPTAMQLWDVTTNTTTDFTTNFTFRIETATTSSTGDGLTFILVPDNTPIPDDSSGGCLALFSNNGNHTGCVLNQTIVAIEFDTFKNPLDPTSEQIGIDVNSTVSAAYVNVSVTLMDKTSHAFISYDSATKNLSVSLSVEESLTPYSVSLSYVIDLRNVLPERVQVGFSAATGMSVELHKILDWSFDSTLEDTLAPSPTPTPQQSVTVAPTPSPISTSQQGTTQGRQSRFNRGLVAGISVGLFLILMCGIGIVWIKIKRKNTRAGNNESAQFDIDQDLEMEAGPRRFAYLVLSKATNNFSIERKIGEGGFGGVYKGILPGPESTEIAVKKIKSGSNQGVKEYISEVKIISRVRHRNLVQLLGWCHDHGELLLVYEFMPNRSLDSHLFNPKLILLPWATRYKIALGLASAVLYLHEEWEQSVVHRDIKSSNVMLDLNFNPKLGDFGLARLADHDVSLQITVLAGTPGYMAPEYLLYGKASKESDVYSFGIVALEIACGRKVIEVNHQTSKVDLVEWVWDLYGKGLILEAVDNRLGGEFCEQEAKCLMMVGLWCSHPDVSHRPEIKQAIATLNFESPLPSLPPQLPVPMYVSPGMNVYLPSLYSSSSMIEGNHPYSSSSSININHRSHVSVGSRKSE